MTVLVKTVLLLVLAAAMLAYDVSKGNWAGRPDRIVYGVLLMPTVYLGFIYVSGQHWPNLDDLIKYVFIGTAKRIVGS